MQYGDLRLIMSTGPTIRIVMRKERVEKARLHSKNTVLGSGFIRLWLPPLPGYYSFHQYARRRLGHFVLLIEGEGFPTFRSIISMVNGRGYACPGLKAKWCWKPPKPTSWWPVFEIPELYGWWNGQNGCGSQSPARWRRHSPTYVLIEQGFDFRSHFVHFTSHIIRVFRKTGHQLLALAVFSTICLQTRACVTPPIDHGDDRPERRENPRPQSEGQNDQAGVCILVEWIISQ